MRLKSWFKWHGETLVVDVLNKVLWPPSSAAAVVVKDGKILALDLEDYLTLPAGVSETGELFEETAKRETLEETGIRIRVGERIKEQINSGGGVEAVFRAEAIGGELNGNHIEGKPKWIPLEKAYERNWRFNRDIKKLLEKSCS